LNTLDIIILALVLISATLGIKKGLLRSIFSLAGILTGLFVATRYNDKLTSALGFLKLEPKLLSLISFIAIVIFVYFLSGYIAGKISGFNSVTKTFDSILGAAFGIMKGLVIASLFCIFTTNTFQLFGSETIDSSKFYVSIVGVAPKVYDYIVHFFPGAKDFYEELNHLIFT